MRRLLFLLFIPPVAWAQPSGPDAAPVLVGDRVLLVSKTEVTQGLYHEVSGTNPSLYAGEALPVDSVSWYDAVAFCNQLSLAQGLDPVYRDDGIDRLRSGWRLPTESEWILLADEAAGDDAVAVAWFVNNSERRTHPVGLLQPNSRGLYDLFGNVWEWCDVEGDQPSQVDHGGGYRSNATLLRRASRGILGPGSWADDLGFRVVRAPSS